MDVSPAALAGLFSAFTWGLGSVLFGRLLRDTPAHLRPTAAAANFFKNGLALIIFLGLWMIWRSEPPDSQTAGWLVWSGALGFGLGDTLYFAALPRCGVQTAAVVGQLNVPLAALLSFLFLDETLTPFVLGAMGLVLVGVLLVVTDGGPAGAGIRAPRTKDPVWRLGVLFAFLTAVSQATAVVTGRGSFGELAILPGTITRLLGGLCGGLVLAFVMGAFTAKRNAESPLAEVRRLVRPVHTKHSWKLLVPPAMAAAVVGLLPFHLALRELPGGVSSVLFATTPLFTLPLGFLFGERHGKRAVIGTLIGFIGVTGIIRAASG